MGCLNLREGGENSHFPLKTKRNSMRSYFERGGANEMHQEEREKIRNKSKKNKIREIR